MKRCRFIVSAKDDAPSNMAMDEALLTCLSGRGNTMPALRVYSWARSCITIGYFQRYSDFVSAGLPVTRRLTGGLSVIHGDDISYAFVAAAGDFPFVYDQQEAYFHIHDIFRRGLLTLGIKAEFHAAPPAENGRKDRPQDTVCVTTLFPHDLQCNGRKILGSCQRRRGKVILQQGSLHLPREYGFDALVSAVKSSCEEKFDAEAVSAEATSEEVTMAESLKRTRYGQSDWNARY